METMTQTEFAKFYGVSQPMVSKYIRDGKIPPEALVTVEENGRKFKKILPDLAVEYIEKNSSPAQRKKPKKPDVDHDFLYEIAELFRQSIVEQKKFAKAITDELIDIAKTGDLGRLKTEAFRRIDQQYVNIWLNTITRINDRYGIDL